MNRIGVGFAVLYEAEASFYENRQMFEKAKKVFEFGLKEFVFSFLFLSFSLFQFIVFYFKKKISPLPISPL